MHKNQDMGYNRLNITDERFTNVSSTVLENIDALTSLNKGNIELEDIENSSSLPQNFSLVELTELDNTIPLVRDITYSLINDIENQKLHCTLATYYPAGGFIGWHTNSNSNFYNAICTFSDTGDSYFEYEELGNVVNTQDLIGWNVKKTFWSSGTPVKHRAVSNCNRITITFSSQNEEEIDTLITNLTSS